jgi:hypothetical protein
VTDIASNSWPDTETFQVNYYVDSQAGSAGNGLSWSQAWKSFGQIDWNAIKPGDTVYISGGTYNDTLEVGASGSSAGGAITITKGVDPGHNGAVVIDGQNNLSNGVEMYGQSYVVIDGLSIRNIANAGVSVKNSSAGVVLQNNDVYSGDPGGGNARGYDVRSSVGTIVRGNSFSTPTNTTAQTDGIYSMENDNATFENNHIVISNNNTNGHSDGIQSYEDKNVTIRANWLQQANTAATNNHGAWISDTQAGGSVEFLNNVVLTPNLTADSAVTHYMEPTWSGTGSAHFMNNTIIGGKRAINLDYTPNDHIMNNIIEPVSGGFGVFVGDGTLAPANVDNNLIWAPSATVANLSNPNLSWTQWQALGYDPHGVNADPQFTDASGGNYSLSATSPAVGHGAALADVSVDNAGTARPQGAAYDIGAFERSAVSTPQASAPPATSEGGAATPGSVATPPVSTPPTTPGGPPPAPSDELVLILSEDFWKGDAKFVATVNGESLGPAQAVTAQHRLGQTEAFTFSGHWGSGPVDVGVSFINDAWGGRPHADRNLYVGSVSHDGVSSPQDVAFYMNGTQHFTV